MPVKSTFVLCQNNLKQRVLWFFFSQYPQSAALTITREFLGLLFVFQAYDAVFGMGIKNVTATFQEGFGMNKPLWDTRNVFHRLILLLILLFTPFERQIWSFEHLLF